jgi:putative hydrolase of the HAD superfamily
MKLQAILLDLDNTLYEYDPCNEAALVLVHQRLAAWGELGADEFRRLHDASRAELAQGLSGQAASHSRLLIFNRVLDQLGWPDRWARALELHEVYWREFCCRMQPAPGLVTTLERLAQHAPLALVTNQTTEVQFRKVGQLGIARHLTEIITSEEAGADKPDPRIFDLALKRLAVRDPACAVMVGDTAGDIDGARRCGLRTVQSLQFPPPQPLTADHSIRDVRELGALLGSW